MTKILGHHNFVSKIENAQKHNKLHPVWLVNGSRGIGKFGIINQEITKILAKDNYLDVFIIDQDPDLHFQQNNKVSNDSASDSSQKKTKESRIPISKIRELIQHLSFKSQNDVGRIVIIDSIDQLTAAATQVLLKTLEEHNTKIVFFLICHDLSLVPKTIQSRSIIVNLNSPKFDEFAIILQGFQPNISEKQTREIYFITRGNPKLAKNFLANSQNNTLLDDLFTHFSDKNSNFVEIKKLAESFDQLNQPQSNLSFKDIAEIIIYVFRQSIIQSKLGLQKLKSESSLVNLASIALQNISFDKKISKVRKLESLLLSDKNLKSSQQIIAAIYSLRS